jgi:hypothetical protein
LSFFSINRLVISSDSEVTVSMRVAGGSSRSICGNLVSASSWNSGCWRSAATRVLEGKSTGTLSTGGST